MQYILDEKEYKEYKELKEFADLKVKQLMESDKSRRELARQLGRALTERDLYMKNLDEADHFHWKVNDKSIKEWGRWGRIDTDLIERCKPKTSNES